MSAADRLAEIEARANAATEGPWRADRSPLGTGALHTVTSKPLVEGRDRFLIAERVLGRDVEFIAHARTDVPKLTAALKAVLAIARRDLDESPDFEERLWDDGFNAALGDASAAIESALGGA